MDSGGGGEDKEQEFVRKNIEPDEFATDTIAERPNDYLLVWADEFNYTGTPDASKWNYEVGNGEVLRKLCKGITLRPKCLSV